MAKLTADQQNIAKYWLHDVLYAGGLIMPNKCARPTDYPFTYNKSSNKKTFIDKSIIICNELKTRSFDFSNVDAALETLSRFDFATTMNTRYWYRHSVTKPASMLAKYLAYFCAINDIKWDDNLRTSFEIEHDRSTVFGSALAEYHLFTSQSNPRTRATAGTSAVSGAPTSNYKSTGGHSGDIPNLIGTPGVKTAGSGSYMFCIVATKIGKNTPSAYITPLRVLGNSVTKVAKSQAMTVKFGSANGYTDCTLWFDDMSNATAALKWCESKFGSKYTGFSLAKKSATPEYFKVETDLGDAFIKAGKLNEELEEELKINPNMTKYGELDEDAYYKYDI